MPLHFRGRFFRFLTSRSGKRRYSSNSTNLVACGFSRFSRYEPSREFQLLFRRSASAARRGVKFPTGFPEFSHHFAKPAKHFLRSVDHRTYISKLIAEIPGIISARHSTSSIGCEILEWHMICGSKNRIPHHAREIFQAEVLWQTKPNLFTWCSSRS